MTGVLASYRFCDFFSAAVAWRTPWADDQSTGVPQYYAKLLRRGLHFVRRQAESFKTYMGSIALTAPESWGGRRFDTVRRRREWI